MNFKEIQKLIELVSKAGITEFSLENDGFKLSICNKSEVITTAVPQQVIAPQAQYVPAQVAPQSVSVAPEASASEKPTNAENNYITIKSPIVGTFYRSSSPDKPSYVNIGDKVENNSIVCIVEAMKLFNEIEAEVSGTIVKVLVEDKTPIEFDQPLFLVDPNG